MDNGDALQAGFMLSAICERQNDIKELEKQGHVMTGFDPFLLLREVAEMSNLKRQNDELTMKQEENLHGYNALVMKNFDDKQKKEPFKPNATVGVPAGYDAASLAEKMSKFKFAKNSMGSGKDANWYSKINGKPEKDGSSMSNSKRLNCGLTEEDERQIHKDMIPGFIAKQKELEPEYQHIKNVGKELQQLKQEFGVVIKHAPSQATTSFMNRRGSQARQYDFITSQMRTNRIQKIVVRKERLQSFNSNSQTSMIPPRNIQTAESNNRGRTRSLLNETPIRMAANSRESHRERDPKHLQSLEEMSKEQSQRSKTIPESSRRTPQSQERKQEVMQEKRESRFHKSQPEDPNVCLDCGYYGCDGNNSCDERQLESGKLQEQQNATLKPAGGHQIQPSQAKGRIKSPKQTSQSRNIENLQNNKDITFQNYDQISENSSTKINNKELHLGRNGLIDRKMTEAMFQKRIKEGLPLEDLNKHEKKISEITEKQTNASAKAISASSKPTTTRLTQTQNLQKKKETTEQQTIDKTTIFSKNSEIKHLSHTTGRMFRNQNKRDEANKISKPMTTQPNLNSFLKDQTKKQQYSSLNSKYRLLSNQVTNQIIETLNTEKSKDTEKPRRTTQSKVRLKNIKNSEFTIGTRITEINIMATEESIVGMNVKPMNKTSRDGFKVTSNVSSRPSIMAISGHQPTQTTLPKFTNDKSMFPMSPKFKPNFAQKSDINISELMKRHAEQLIVSNEVPSQSLNLAPNFHSQSNRNKSRDLIPESNLVVNVSQLKNKKKKSDKIDENQPETIQDVMRDMSVKKSQLKQAIKIATRCQTTENLIKRQQFNSSVNRQTLNVNQHIESRTNLSKTKTATTYVPGVKGDPVTYRAKKKISDVINNIQKKHEGQSRQQNNHSKTKSKREQIAASIYQEVPIRKLLTPLNKQKRNDDQNQINPTPASRNFPQIKSHDTPISKNLKKIGRLSLDRSPELVLKNMMRAENQKTIELRTSPRQLKVQLIQKSTRSVQRLKIEEKANSVEPENNYSQVIQKAKKSRDYGEVSPKSLPQSPNNVTRIFDSSTIDHNFNRVSHNLLEFQKKSKVHEVLRKSSSVEDNMLLQSSETNPYKEATPMSKYRSFNIYNRYPKPAQRLALRATIVSPLSAVKSNGEQKQNAKNNYIIKNKQNIGEVKPDQTEDYNAALIMHNSRISSFSHAQTTSIRIDDQATQEKVHDQNLGLNELSRLRKTIQVNQRPSLKKITDSYNISQMRKDSQNSSRLRNYKSARRDKSTGRMQKPSIDRSNNQENSKTHRELDLPSDTNRLMVSLEPETDQKSVKQTPKKSESYPELEKLDSIPFVITKNKAEQELINVLEKSYDSGIREKKNCRNEFTGIIRASLHKTFDPAAQSNNRESLALYGSEIETDVHLNKINNFLKKKVRDKKIKEKALKDTIVHDKISHMRKDTKLSKKEKNQLAFLRQLENRLNTKSKNFELQLHHKLKSNANLMSNYVTGDNFYNKASLSTSSKIMSNRVSGNNLKLSSNILSQLMSKAKTRNKVSSQHNQVQMTSLAQQKLLYGDDQKSVGESASLTIGQGHTFYQKGENSRSSSHCNSRSESANQLLRGVGNSIIKDMIMSKKVPQRGKQFFTNQNSIINPLNTIKGYLSSDVRTPPIEEEILFQSRHVKKSNKASSPRLQNLHVNKNRNTIYAQQI